MSLLIEMDRQTTHKREARSKLVVSVATGAQNNRRAREPNLHIRI